MGEVVGGDAVINGGEGSRIIFKFLRNHEDSLCSLWE